MPSRGIPENALSADGRAHERWLPIAGWEGWYEVGDLGNVRRVRGGVGTRAGRLLHPAPHANGSRCVMLSRPGTQRQAMVHHLVADAFLGERPAYHRLAWTNGDRTDNRADNLSYQSRLEVAPPAPRRDPYRAFSDDEVRAVRRLLATTGAYILARRYGVPVAAISNIKKGATHRGVGDEE